MGFSDKIGLVPGVQNACCPPYAGAKFWMSVRHSDMTSHELTRLLEDDMPDKAYAAMGFSKEEPYTLEQLKAEKEKAAHSVLAGFEEYAVTKDAYIKLKSLFRLMPKEQREQMEAGLKQMLRTTGAKEICSGTVLAFVENLSIEEGQKNMLLGMIG